VSVSPVDKRDEARLCERFEQFQLLGGLRGVEVDAPDAVPEPLVAALLHAVRVGDRPHAGRHTQHTHTHTHAHTHTLLSGVAGPLAGRGGGQICRPFVLGWTQPETQCYSPGYRGQVRAAAVMLCFYCTQTHMKLQPEFSREFLKTIFARLPPLASAARCGPHPPRHASDATVYFTRSRAVLTNGHTGHVPGARGFFIFEGPPTGCDEIIFLN